MRILPLTASHDWQGFDCVRPELNAWLRGVAGRHQKEELSKTFVVVLEEAPRVIWRLLRTDLTDVDTGALAEIQRKRLLRVTVRA
jgi:hypothetical protein